MVQRKRHGRFRAPKLNHFRHPKSYKVVCSGCGKEATVPVLPPAGKELLCIECFSKSAISKEET
jgi:CxxC-x17-CxxC domain-containing protein